MPPCLIGMEACGGAHHLSHRLKALGHDARLMPAKYVRPYSKGQKNDFRDAPFDKLRRPNRLRSEEHTSELQSHSDIVCRLLLEKKKESLSASSAVFGLVALAAFACCGVWKGGGAVAAAVTVNVRSGAAC